ncbi:MAG: hypothetical protein J6Y09_06610 [Lachnospiraceae bacterium]|nr:hypothetical protein [Lachnospiraceae bacterium]
MIFGIKTKKDKQIERLEENNKILQERVASMYYKHPQIITTQGNVIAMAATQILEKGMPSEYAKRAVANKLVDEAVRFIHYDLTEVEGQLAFKGYIQVVTYGNK